MLIGKGSKRRLLHIPDCVQKELLEYAEEEGIRSGQIFLTRSGKLMVRAHVNADVYKRQISSWATCSVCFRGMTTVRAAWGGISCTAHGCSCIISYTGSTGRCARQQPTGRTMAARKVIIRAIAQVRQAAHTGTAATVRTVEAAGRHRRGRYTACRKLL